MSKSTKILLIVLGFFLLIGMHACSSYNGFVKTETKVQEMWGNVQSAYQYRMDLIPNLVNTVKGAANFEKSTLEAVVNARANATRVTIDPTNLTPEKIQQFQKAQDALSGTLSRLLAVAENYPDLKATKNFENLQDELQRTEARIKNARENYNKVVADYNVSVRRFPSNIYAGMFGFERKGFFEAAQGAENAPGVNFEEDKK